MCLLSHYVPRKKNSKIFVLKNLESQHLKNFDKKKKFKLLSSSTNKVPAFPLYKQQIIGLIGALFILSSKNKKITNKNPLCKISYIFSKKSFLIFWENGTVIFQEMELSSPKIKMVQEETFRARKNKKKPTLKIFFIF